LVPSFCAYMSMSLVSGKEPAILTDRRYKQLPCEALGHERCSERCNCSRRRRGLWSMDHTGPGHHNATVPDVSEAAHKRWPRVLAIFFIRHRPHVETLAALSMNGGQDKGKYTAGLPVSPKPSVSLIPSMQSRSPSKSPSPSVV
jgi:hypothetical protein